MNIAQKDSAQESIDNASKKNPSPQEYDVVVLGCGEGGKYLAWTLARQGKRVAVIERKYIGGSCPNIACLPSKNIIHSAKVASFVARSEEFGITKDNVRIDMDASA
ncbi:MAG TPA: FAD-dependent oxidoreductase [Terracidiphilus sp.]|jgi:pyruvate/2-oxoglutarate dehydrogenase complex dihydrolipoamide dehydrogenase (E3) component